MKTRTRNRMLGVLAALLLAVPFATAGFAGSHDVDVVDNSFDPETLTVTAGDEVTWMSSGSNPHTVTADDGSFDSSPDCDGFADSASGACMDEGESFSHTFDEPGTYPYYCKLHGSEGGGGMAGTIVVEAAASDGSGTDGDTSDGADSGGGSAEEAEVTGSITVSDQTGDGTTVVVDSVTITGADGFVVVHADGGGSPGAVIGHAPITEGTSTDVSVTLDQALTADATVWPMLHEDAGEPGTYEFPGADGPVMNEDGVVVAPLSYTVDADAGTLPRTGPASAGAIALGAAVVVSAGLLLLSARRPSATPRR